MSSTPNTPKRFAAGDELSLLPAQQALTNGPNHHWVQEHWRARLATARGNAELTKGIGWVRMAIHGSPASPPGAMRANAYLPTNLRYSGPRHQTRLIADGWVEPELFDASIHEFRNGVRGAGPRTRPWTPPDSGESESLKGLVQAIAASDADLDVVPRPPGWELGARIRGRRVAVRVTPEPGGIRLYRSVLDASRFEAGSCVETSVCDVSLRLNRRIRFSRFALHGGGLVVEARLSGPLIDEPRIVESTHAIAVVSQEFGPVFDLLSRYPDVARCYARIFQPHAKEYAA
jgi:hypothetical protein